MAKVETSTIVNFFPKAGILKDQQKSAQSNDDDPFRDLQNQIKKLGEFCPPGTTSEDVVSLDENVVCTVPLLTDEELIAEMNNDNGDDADNGQDDDNNALLTQFSPKLVIFGRHWNCCMTTCPSILAVKIFNRLGISH